MRFLKLDLLTLLISLFLFASCENTSTIGLEVDPSSAIQGNLIDTATITSKTIKDNDAPTYAAGGGLSRYPFGYLNDPAIGTTESSLALAVNLPSESYSFGTNAVLDSAVLVLNFDGEFYGDSTVNYNINVRQLTNNLATESSYEGSRAYPYETAALATYNGKVYPATPYKVTDVVVGAADTLRTVTPQLRIKLNNDFVTSNIVNLPSTSLKYNSYFQNAFKGLHLHINAASKAAMANGGMMFFDMAGTTSGLMLYYKKQNATTTTARDTVAVNFPIATTDGPVAASVSHTYTTTVQAQLDNPAVQSSVTYLKPLAGLRNKLAFPYLKKLGNEVGKMIVNKAELVIDISNGSDIVPFKAAPRLALYRNDIAGQRKNVPDNDVPTQTYRGDQRANPTTFGGYFDSVKKQYVFVVTAYVQDLIDGKDQDYGTFLSVTPSSTFQITPSYNVAARAIIGSFKKNPAPGDKLLKLNIYYTKVN